MAKKKKKKQIVKPRAEKKPLSLGKRNQNIACIGLILLLLLIFFYKAVFLGMVPYASDTVAWRGSAQCMLEYHEKTGKTALWNSNMFSGMPGYMISAGSKVPSITALLKPIFLLFKWQVTYLLIAGTGMYFLLLRFKVDKTAALIGAVSFIFTTTLFGLLEAGHNTKFRTIAFIPWAFMATDYLFRKRNLFSVALAILALSLQLRENHPQIIYYTWMMLGIYWLLNSYYYFKEGNRKAILTTGLLFAAVIVFSLATVAQPYLSNYEYSKFTIRGGSGLSTDYATSWSFHPAEILTFLIPNFFGGVSPYYWGWMPFNTSSVYMGLIPLVLAIVALIYNKTRVVRFMMIISVISLLLAFGRHFSILSTFLLNYLPYFNRFRAPSMILILLAFAMPIMGAYGIDFLFKSYSNKKRVNLKTLERIVTYTTISLIGLFLISLIAKSSLHNILPFIKNGDAQRYTTATMARLKLARFDLLFKDWIRMVIFLVAALGLMWLQIKRKINLNLLKFGFLALIVIDLWTIDIRFFRNLEYPVEIDKRTFAKKQTDEFLLNDKSLFRVFPLGQLFGDNRWAYYHQTIGGYHAAKLHIYQDMLEHCLYKGWDTEFPLNMNIVNMLNVKYLITQGRLPDKYLKLVNYDQANKYLTYFNSDMLPRVFFVNSFEVIKEREKIFERLNSPDFNPGTEAILEEDPQIEIVPTDKRHVEIESYDLHHIRLFAKTDKPSLLVLSEIYYPAGWKAYVDGRESKIHKTNYILRSIYLPPGDHRIELIFDPWTYKVGLWISSVTELLLLSFIGFEGFRWVRRQKVATK